MSEKPKRPPPPYMKLGAGAHYTRIDVLADLMGTTDKGIRHLVSLLGLPIAHFPGMAESHYVLTYAFESALFALGMPKAIREQEGLLRVHQELAGVLYGSLSKEVIRDRVKMLATALTSSCSGATIGKRRKRSKSSHTTWGGRKPSD